MWRYRTRADWIAKVADMANLLAAWRAVRRNHGGEGLDGVTIQAFQAHLETNLHAIQQALCAHTYQPCALKRVALAKPDHRRRLIGIPTVADRVVQHAILTVLEPHFEATFCPGSYGFRPGALSPPGDPGRRERPGGRAVVGGRGRPPGLFRHPRLDDSPPGARNAHR